VVRAIRNPSTPLAGAATLTGLGVVVAAVLALEFRGQILGAVDRFFFREALDRERMVRALVVELSRVTSHDELIASLRLGLDAIFHPNFVEIGTAQNGDPEHLSVPIPEPGALPKEWLVLGPKKSEEAWSTADRELMDLVAAQAGLVRENLLQAERRVDAVMAERNRIARELHDAMSQGFAGISLNLEAAHTAIARAPEKVPGFLERARLLAKSSMKEMRASVRGLRETGGLEARLRALVTMAPARPAVDVEIEPGVCEMASAESAWHLGRIADEAVANAIKHSFAERVVVQLRAKDGSIVLRITDDGIGFDPAVVGKRGYGLQGMRERVESLHGTIDLRSEPGKGTEIVAALPVGVAEPVVGPDGRLTNR
jgi:signal transduction histidine kinase